MGKIFLLLTLILSASCASNTGIINIGEEKYFIAKQAATGFSGTGSIKTESLKEAAAYCTAQNKELNVIKLDENEGPYILGKYPRVELTFTCI
ncbi:hypothetical protein CW740_06400 [Kangiella profundi]|uniref:Uncharacterized protein n=1 Tax=Kangiella profundi TaxID=1561924 RepID=A0A2K9AET4_9GAMM|nr:hypothetical protein [Kangiella profundi]AUD78896.1 hypothetical protein CW740_06400 [Kangiella profundi]GGF03174.1 hypothetical protein GCM10011356_16130 [Kangiella profundi]